jgi:hypothetical protein
VTPCIDTSSSIIAARSGKGPALLPLPARASCTCTLVYVHTNRLDACPCITFCRCMLRKAMRVDLMSKLNLRSLCATG